jgi:hypothetical protein
MRWPGVIAAGRTSNMPVTIGGLLSELSGTHRRAGVADAVLDGVSLVSHVRGGAAPAREAIFWHYPHYHAAGINGPAGAVRAGDRKLVEYYETTLTGRARRSNSSTCATIRPRRATSRRRSRSASRRCRKAGRVAHRHRRTDADGECRLRSGEGKAEQGREGLRKATFQRSAAA